MLKNTIVFMAFLLLSLHASSQLIEGEPNLNTKTLSSIYSFNSPILTSTPIDSTTFNYQIPKFDFIYIDFRDLEQGAFTINFENFGKKPSRLIYESYNDYFNYPLRGFMRKYDPTLWWICP